MTLSWHLVQQVNRIFNFIMNFSWHLVQQVNRILWVINAGFLIEDGNLVKIYEFVV